jgi:DNA-binding transcriptional ArsR family regulator
VFRAVADPTRRAVLETLADEQQLAVTELARRLDVSVPLLSRHLAVLRAAGVVTDQPSGRQRLYSINPAPLRELSDWAALFSEFWTDRIERLRAHLDREAAQTTSRTSTTKDAHDS